METTLERQNIQLLPPPYNDFDVDDQQGEQLFNQISLQSHPPLIQEQSPLQQPKQISQTPKKIKSFKIMKKNMELDSDQAEDQNLQEGDKISSHKIKTPKMDKKKRKQLKKLKKKLKRQRMRQKHKLKNGSGLKRLRKQGDDEQKSNNQWSGESSEQLDQDSDMSSDSLLNNLNPRKKKDSIKKTEKKQGFSLKQLGNDPEVQYNNQELPSDDSQYKNRHGKTRKEKVQKKEVTKNQQILKSLLEIGLCVDEQNQQHKKEGYQYDNGLEQIQNMKGSKKKGPKIKNKLFLDIDIEEEEQNNNPLPKQIELEVKPRTNLGCSRLTNSFLNKAERLKKVRGMQSQMQNEQFDKIMSLKTKQSMAKLISQKQIQEADQIELDVKVPQVIKGRQQLNNTMFLKRISSNISNNKIQPPTAPPAPKKQMNRNEHKAVINRFDFFKSVAQDAKARRSRQITEQLIKNNFKVTKLQEIEEMRKKNEQKRKKDALIGSDREEDSDQQSSQKKNNIQEDVVHENKLKFLNFKIEVNRQKIEQEKEKNQNQNQMEAQKIELEGNEIQKQNVQVKKVETQKLPDKQYKKLLRMEEEGDVQNDGDGEAQSSSELKSNNQQVDQIMNQLEMKSENEVPAGPENQNQLDQDMLNEAQPVNIEVDVEVSNQQDQEDSELNEQQGSQQLQNKKPERNEEHQQYLSFLEAEGIELKKNNKKAEKEKYLQNKISDQKENNQLIQNNNEEQYFQSDARKEFRKLRKLATIIKIKRQAEKKVKRAGEFFDEEAEQGSDNEEHDHEVKKINDEDEEKQYEGLDLDADLEELIDNAVDIDQQNQELAFKKYMEDVKIQDREELKRIMKGDFKRNRQNDHIIDQMEQDQKKRIERMEQIQQYLKQKQEQDGKGLYIQDQNKPQDNQSQNESNEDEKNEKKPILEEIQVVDEMNEQNLKRYLDDKVVQTFRTTTIVRRPIFELPESYKRSKNTDLRNTMKPKESTSETFKLKKTSSHLNEMIMKNKQKLKPLPFLKGFSLPVRK